MYKFKALSFLVYLTLITIGTAVSTIAITVYDFGASWCGSCHADIARDNELSTAYKGKVTFVFVDEDVDHGKAAAFISAAAPNFSVKYDPDHSFAKSMGAGESVPSLVIVSNGGKEVIRGSISKESLKSKLDAKLGTHVPK